MAWPYSQDLGNLTQALDYNGDDNLIYQGAASSGSLKSAAAWQIKKFTYNEKGNLIDVQWADGNFEFDNVWDDRKELNYS